MDLVLDPRLCCIRDGGKTREERHKSNSLRVVFGEELRLKRILFGAVFPTFKVTL
jgi:hypothetical protein